jgi:hypothetical protein
METIVLMDTSATAEQPQKPKGDMKKVFPRPPVEDHISQDSALAPMPVTT